MNKKQLKKIAYFLGKFLGVVGLVYVFYTLSQEYTFSSFIKQFSFILHMSPIFILLNVLSLLIGIYVWHIMLLRYSQEPFSYATSYHYFAKTEISKYLPGNIFHLVGRQALASKIGISQMEMAKISFLLTFLLLTGTVLASTLFALLTSEIHLYILVGMILSSIISLIVIFYIYPTFPSIQKIKMNLLLSLSIALQGIMLGIIIVYQSDTFTLDTFFLSVSIYIVSWLIGFVTPGASGGLGVREGTFIAITTFLQVNIASEVIIFSVLLVRLINIFVDILAYLSTFIVTPHTNQIKR